MTTPEQQAEELLPWTVFSCETADEAAWEKIVAAVAAALGAKDQIIEQWKLIKESNDNGLKAMIAERDAEIERLTKALDETVGERNCDP